MNGLIAKLGAPADLSRASPHSSVQQLLHATKSLPELNPGSALDSLQVWLVVTLCMRMQALPLVLCFAPICESLWEIWHVTLSIYTHVTYMSFISPLGSLEVPLPLSLCTCSPYQPIAQTAGINWSCLAV